jgi:hypothetical protein
MGGENLLIGITEDFRNDFLCEREATVADAGIALTASIAISIVEDETDFR